MSAKQRRMLSSAVCGGLPLIVFPVFVQASQIAGSINEITNGDFEQGAILNPPPFWMVAG